MNERPYTGLTAEVKVGNVPIAYISGIDLTLEKAIIEILQFGARYQEKVPAIKNWTATADGTVAFAPGGSQMKLYDAFQNDEEVTLGIFLDEFSYFEGQAYISNLGINGAPDDKMNLSCDFEGNGAIILTLPTTYVVKVSSGVGGTVTPGGSTRVASAGTHVVTIVPAYNQAISSVIDNGADVTSSVVDKKYTISNITTDHVITVTFTATNTANKTALRTAVNYVNTLSADTYTSATWDDLQIAKTAANIVIANNAATQEQVDEAYDELSEALEALERE